MTTKTKIIRLAVVLALAGAAWAWKEYTGGGDDGGTTAPPPAVRTEVPPAPSAPPAAERTDRDAAPAARRAPPRDTRPTDDVATVEQAFADGRSDVIVEVEALVVKTLPDDDEGSRHQRFIVRLTRDLTVLVAHNIDLAPRVPLSEGDRIRIKGEYEWSDKGGVLHWTHHDPGNRRPGGWIEHDGKRYE